MTDRGLGIAIVIHDITLPLAQLQYHAIKPHGLLSKISVFE